MRHESPLPIEFVTLAGKVHFVIQQSRNEYSSSCPECGGGMHQDGRTYPDRFRMWPVSKYGKPLGWCRSCGYVWTPTTERKPTREEIELWRQEQIRQETERKAAAERALALLNNEHLWEQFAKATTQESRDLCKAWGIPDSWQEYLKLGYLPDYRVAKGEDTYHSPAITIPVWWAGNKVQNIKLRVLNPKDGNDRYRNWYRTGEHYLYMPVHDVEFEAGGIILVEGEKKAMVTEIYNPTNCRVIGMQSIRPDPELFLRLTDCEPVYIIPDPDAFLPAKNGGENGVDYLVRNLGKERARIVRLPVKVDDGIVKHGLNLDRYIRLATRAK